MLAPSKNGFGLVAWRHRAEIRVASLAVDWRNQGQVVETVLRLDDSHLFVVFVKDFCVPSMIPTFPTTGDGTSMRTTQITVKGEGEWGWTW